MPRKDKFEDKWILVDTLNAFASENPPDISYYYIRNLVAMGYIEVTSKKKSNSGMGKPAYVYGLTSKAKQYLGLSKNWKRPTPNVDRPENSEESKAA